MYIKRVYYNKENNSNAILITKIAIKYLIIIAIIIANLLWLNFVFHQFLKGSSSMVTYFGSSFESGYLLNYDESDLSLIYKK